MLLLTVFWISGRCGHPGDNNNKSPEDESFVCVREEKNSFVLWVVGIAGSAGFRRTRMESDIEFVLPVRLANANYLYTSNVNCA